MIFYKLKINKRLLTQVVLIISLILLTLKKGLADPGDDDSSIKSYIAVSDIEGIKRHWDTLIQNKTLTFDKATQLMEMINPDNRLWFIGDLMRRGPHGKATYKYVMNLISNNDGSSLGLIGNHDGNILSFISTVANIELGANEEYEEWVLKQLKENSKFKQGRYAQMQWWSEKFGLKDKALNWWIESAAEVKGVDPLNSDFQKLISNNAGEISVEKLAQILNPEEMAEEFYRFCSPGGLGFEYLRKANLITVVDSEDQIRTILLHSGTLTKGNLGVIPGANAKYYEMYPNEDWLKKFEKDVNAWKDEGLNRIEGLLDKLNNKASFSLSEQKEFARELGKVHLIKYVDAGYDSVTRTLEYEANSLVYPQKHLQKYSNIPGTFSQEVTDLLTSDLVHVNNVYGGHIPVGDFAVLRKAYSVKNGKFINILLGDTSYSPVEGNGTLKFRSDGYIKVTGQSRDGISFVSEVLPEKTYAQYLASGDEALIKKARQLEKIGMVADGYLIVGFESRLDPMTNEIVPDYDKYILLKQDGYNFDYKMVDIWGMEEFLKHNELKFPVSDLSDAYKKAYLNKQKMLETHEKVSLTDKEFSELLNGKKVIISSGPANASLDPVLDSVNGNPDHVKAYLDDWRAYLLSLPGDEEVILVGGGTSGLEELKNKVAAEVNEVRALKGQKSFEIVGVITGVTGGSELDKNVQKFVVSHAFFWDDYFPELMKMIDDTENIKSLRLEFAGGGGIIPNQIDHARNLKMQGMDMEIVLGQGLSSKTGKRSISGTDKVINAALENPMGSRDIKIRKLEDYHRYPTLPCLPIENLCPWHLARPETRVCPHKMD